MIINFNNFINENLKNKLKGISPENLSPENREKYDLIMYIKDNIEKYGQDITMSDMEASSSPIYTEDSLGIHLIETLTIDEANVVVYGGYNNQDEITEYNINYFELNINILKEIKDILSNAIECELLKEDI